MKKIIASAALAAAVATAADAQVYFKAPMDFAGTGCPAGSMTVTGEDSATLTIMFDKYDAAKPFSKARSQMERTSCSFAVPVRVPAGYQVSVLTADWMGYAEGSTELFREYFFAGGDGISKTSNPSGNYIERDDDLTHETSSSCGEDVILRINSSVRAIDSDSYIAVDTVDLQNQMVLHLKQSTCGQRALPAVLMLLL